MSTATLLPKTNVNLKTIALPASHGGWGFLLEPILLALLVAPSLAGLWLGLAALGAFLSQQPLKLALTDRRKNRRYPRSVWAERIALLYSGLAVITFGLALLTTANALFWLPLLAAVPLAVVQLYFDAQNRGRELLPELSGAIALGSVASAAALAGGWNWLPALALWGILTARTVGSIIYVRARLRLERGQPIAIKPVWASHSAAVVAVAGLAAAELLPWLAVGAMLILLVRAIAGLSNHRQPVKPKIVGFQEMGYGILTVLFTAIGYAFMV